MYNIGNLLCQTDSKKEEDMGDLVFSLPLVDLGEDSKSWSESQKRELVLNDLGEN